MGKIRDECVDGCSCQERTWTGHIERRVSQPAMGALRVHVQDKRAHEACPCTVRLRVLNESQSGGYKAKLVALLSGFYMYKPYALDGS